MPPVLHGNAIYFSFYFWCNRLAYEHMDLVHMLCAVSERASDRSWSRMYVLCISRSSYVQYTSNETESGLILLMVKLSVSSLCDPIIPLFLLFSWVCKRQSLAICNGLHIVIPSIHSIPSAHLHRWQLNLNDLQWYDKQFDIWKKKKIATKRPFNISTNQNGHFYGFFSRSWNQLKMKKKKKN